MATPEELIALAAQLRTALPHRAPLRIAEMVQHCVVRLEMLADASSSDDLRAQQERHAQQLLALCRSYRVDPLRIVTDE